MSSSADDELALQALRPAPPLTWRERALDVVDAIGVSPTRLVGGVIGATAAAAALVWVLRPPPPPVEATLPVVSPASATSTSTTSAATVIVHVAGAVRSPGVRELAAGSRVIDAIEAAGGLAASADAGRLNLAAVVRDGERVYVPEVGEQPPPAVGGGSGGTGGTPSASGPVDLNAATLEQLDALPGIGPATAAAIVQWRETNGPFTSVDELLDVRGIGEAKLEQVRALVVV